MKRLAILLLAATPFAARAQSQTPDTANDRSGLRAREFWVGYSKSSPKWGVLGNRPGLSFAIAAARMTRRIKTTPGYALDWTVDVVPLALSSPPLGYQYYQQGHGYIDLQKPGPQVTNCLVQVFGCRFPNGSAYGAGISPLGVTAVYRRNHLLQTRLGATGGILMFDR